MQWILIALAVVIILLIIGGAIAARIDRKQGYICFVLVGLLLISLGLSNVLVTELQLISRITIPSGFVVFILSIIGLKRKTQ